MGDLNDTAVMFDTAFHSLEKSLGKRLDASLRAGFHKLGVDFAHLQPAYPLETWEACLALVARTIFPALSKEEAWRQIGREFLEGYTQTTLGQAALMMGKVVGVRRMLHRMERNLRTATNTSRVSVVDLDTHRLELTIALDERFLPVWKGRELSLAHHRRGLLEGTLMVLGTIGSVELIRVDRELQRTTYLVTWQ